MSDIRRYSRAEIEEMRRRGEVVVAADAPEGPALEDDDWEEAFAGEADAGSADGERASVALRRDIVRAFQQAEPRYWRERMERVLSDYAEGRPTSGRRVDADPPGPSR